MPKLPGIKEVAKRARVSTSTVSHVINKTRNVSPELRARVLRAIKQLGYRPNALARGLRRSETRTLGLLVPDNSNPFFSEVAKGVEDAGFRHGYSVILCNAGDDLEKELAYVDALISKRVDGVVFIAATLSNHHIQPLIESDVPVVIVDRELPGIEADVVLSDNYRGGYQAARYLIELGHRRIACITGPSNLSSSAARVSGYRAALEENGLSVDEALIVRGDFHYQGGIDGVKTLMRLPEFPTAIFACNDLMAIGALRSLHRQNLRVPKDVSIIGFDDIAQASFVSPSLSTIAQLKYEIGQIVVKMLVDRISDRGPDQKKRIILETELVIRESAASRMQMDG